MKQYLADMYAYRFNQYLNVSIRMWLYMLFLFVLLILFFYTKYDMHSFSFVVPVISGGGSS